MKTSPILNRTHPSGWPAVIVTYDEPHARNTGGPIRIGDLWVNQAGLIRNAETTPYDDNAPSVRWSPIPPSPDILQCVINDLKSRDRSYLAYIVQNRYNP